MELISRNRTLQRNNDVLMNTVTGGELTQDMFSDFIAEMPNTRVVKKENMVIGDDEKEEEEVKVDCNENK